MDVIYKPILSEQTHFLRQKILRPQQALKDMVYPLDKEKGSYHVGAFMGENLIGIASVYPESQSGELRQGDWRLRGMAIDSEWQGKGIGRLLVKECEKYTQKQKARTLWCNARTSAIGFYIALGFEKVGEEFEIPGIGPHYIAKLNLL